MTDDIEAKAIKLLNELRKERGCVPRMMIYRETNIEDEALCRAIEQHEAFKQEVSDAVEDAFGLQGGHTLHRFIIPKPKPDPLKAVLASAVGRMESGDKLHEALSAALDDFGLEIRSKNDE